MERINKERKGIVYGLMTKEEQQCLKDADNVVYYIHSGIWKEKDYALFSKNVAYWVSEWNEQEKRYDILEEIYKTVQKVVEMMEELDKE
jgi:N-acetylglucosamine kinase-like BadF-type ATPase